MPEERLAERPHTTEAPGRLACRVQHVPLEDLGRRFDRRQLELLLRLEVGVEAALAHADVLGQLADGKSLQPPRGRQVGGRVQYGAPALHPVRPWLPPRAPFSLRPAGLKKVGAHT